MSQTKTQWLPFLTYDFPVTTNEQRFESENLRKDDIRERYLHPCP